MTKKKALIVIPTFNERENIGTLIPQIQDVIGKIEKWSIDILIVDDNSPDGTYDEAVKLQKRYKNIHIIQGEKKGLGRAYLRGFAYGAEKINPFIMLEMDADGQHNPNLIPQFLSEIEKGADFVIGSRYIKGGSIPEHWTIDRKFYSVVGNMIASAGFMNFSVHDWTSGFRAIKSWLLKDVADEMKDHNGYEFQIALLDKAIKRHLIIKEIPLQFTDRKIGVSKLSSSIVIPNTLLYIFRNSSFIKFAIVGLLGFIVDFGIAAMLISAAALSAPTANALSAECAIIFNFFMNNYWSFKHKRIQSGFFSFIQKLLKFNLISSGSIIIQWLGLIILISLFGEGTISLLGLSNIPSWAVYKVFLIAFIIIPYSYFMYNRFIWKKP
ncbi:glycosyltransferase [Candidatus Woesebacteria bacterium]|jgi:dolichol-phosphate mannosyltransferase|nr:glycosyltransferase [Candidatus Woesebacteria bacterium]